eukprot:1160568-Pelagomonas_calceolata.AAC.4
MRAYHNQIKIKLIGTHERWDRPTHPVCVKSSKRQYPYLSSLSPYFTVTGSFQSKYPSRTYFSHSLILENNFEKARITKNGAIRGIPSGIAAQMYTHGRPRPNAPSGQRRADTSGQACVCVSIHALCQHFLRSSVRLSSPFFYPFPKWRTHEPNLLQIST